MSGRRLAALLSAIALGGCSRSAPQDAAPPAASASAAPVASGRTATLARHLPPAAGGFVGGPVELGDVYARRRYTKGAAHVELTIGDAGAATVTYAQWLKMSAADPPVRLDVGRENAAGFYDCTGAGDAERCDAHIHMRAGYHVEVMSGGSATRSEIEAFLGGLSLRGLAQGAP